MCDNLSLPGILKEAEGQGEEGGRRSRDGADSRAHSWGMGKRPGLGRDHSVEEGKY